MHCPCCYPAPPASQLPSFHTLAGPACLPSPPLRLHSTPLQCTTTTTALLHSSHTHPGHATALIHSSHTLFLPLWCMPPLPSAALYRLPPPPPLTLALRVSPSLHHRPCLMPCAPHLCSTATQALQGRGPSACAAIEPCKQGGHQHTTRAGGSRSRLRANCVLNALFVS